MHGWDMGFSLLKSMKMLMLMYKSLLESEHMRNMLDTRAIS